MDSRPDILGTPLGQFGLGALALVIGGALLFTLIGAVSSDDDATPTAAETEATDTTGDTGDTEAPTGSPTDGADETPTDGATGPDDEGTTDGATDGPTGTATEATFEPGDITIQVLDAGGDGGTAHDAVVGCLEDAGYDSLIPNDAAVVYDATTVFYTPGGDNQAMAQQAASAIGVASVEEKPSNLSDTVPVHVVVGGDGASIC